MENVFERLVGGCLLSVNKFNSLRLFVLDHSVLLLAFYARIRIYLCWRRSEYKLIYDQRKYFIARTFVFTNYDCIQHQRQLIACRLKCDILNIELNCNSFFF